MRRIVRLGVDLLLGVRSRVSLNWYVDVDGESHRLRTAEGWSDIVVKDLALPADDIVPFGAVDAGHLRAALHEVGNALHTAHLLEHSGEDQEAPALPLHLVAAARNGTQHLLVSGKVHGIALSRSVAWSPIGDGPALNALSSTDQLEALSGAAGSMQLSLGADEEWTATLSLADSTARHRLRLLRDPIGSPPFRLIEGPNLVRCMLPTSELTALIAEVPPAEAVTIAFVPGRVLIRSATGMIGMLKVDTAGEPRQGTFPAGSVRAGLDALGDDIEQVRLALFDEPDRPSLRVDSADFDSRCSVLASGWSYR